MKGVVKIVTVGGLDPVNLEMLRLKRWNLHLFGDECVAPFQAGSDRGFGRDSEFSGQEQRPERLPISGITIEVVEPAVRLHLRASVGEGGRLPMRCLRSQDSTTRVGTMGGGMSHALERWISPFRFCDPDIHRHRPPTCASTFSDEPGARWR